jgi:hypothetical protein
VILGILSASLSIIAASILVGYFGLGVIGLCLGFIAGRSLLSVGYPILIGRFLGISFSSQLYNALRPSILTGLLFFLSTQLVNIAIQNAWSVASSWLSLVFACGVTVLIVSILAFYLGLSKDQRKRIISRARLVL